MSDVKIFIPDGYPKKVEADGKYIIFGMEVTTSDGTMHTVPVSEFRYTGDSKHFDEQDTEEANLVLLQACLELLAMQYEKGNCMGMNVSQQKIVEDNGWDVCPDVTLAGAVATDGGSDLTVDLEKYETPVELAESAAAADMAEAIEE